MILLLLPSTKIIDKKSSSFRFLNPIFYFIQLKKMFGVEKNNLIG